MKGLSTLGRVLAGVLLVGLGSLAFLGCGGDVIAPGIGGTTVLKSTVPAPAAPTGTDTTTGATQFAVKPTDPTTAVLKLTDPINFTAPAGSSIATTGTPVFSAAQADANGNPTTPLGNLSLAQKNGVVSTSDKALLPEGDNVLTMTGGALQLDDLLSGLTGATTRGRQSLMIAGLTLKYTVSRNPIYFTMPSSWEMDLQQSNGKYILRGSEMYFYWSGNYFRYPADKKAIMTLDLYDGSTKTGHVTQTVTCTPDTTVGAGSCRFAGRSNILFNKAYVTLDMRNSK